MTEQTSPAPVSTPSPGAMLKAERELQQLPPRETADRLNWMPGYVALVENDDYQKLRNPAFARGYVKSYGKLLGLEEGPLMAAFESIDQPVEIQARPRTVLNRPLQFQRTGVGILIGLGMLFVLILVLWWQGQTDVTAQAELAVDSQQIAISEVLHRPQVKRDSSGVQGAHDALAGIE